MCGIVESVAFMVTGRKDREKMKKTEFNQIAYQNEYIKEKYDRINLLVPKGKKEKIRKAAEEAGKSVNEYINSLIDEKIGK